MRVQMRNGVKALNAIAKIYENIWKKKQTKQKRKNKRKRYVRRQFQHSGYIQLQLNDDSGRYLSQRGQNNSLIIYDEFDDVMMTHFSRSDLI